MLFHLVANAIITTTSKNQQARQPRLRRAVAQGAAARRGAGGQTGPATPGPIQERSAGGVYREDRKSGGSASCWPNRDGRQSGGVTVEIKMQRLLDKLPSPTDFWRKVGRKLATPRRHFVFYAWEDEAPRPRQARTTSRQQMKGRIFTKSPLLRVFTHLFLRYQNFSFC